MAAGSWKVFTNAKNQLGEGDLPLDTGAGWTIYLVTTGWAPDLTDQSVTTSNINTNRSTNGGATGKDISTPTWTATGNSYKWEAGVTGVQWTAAGGTMNAAYAIIWADHIASPVADPVVAYVDLDTGGGNIAVTSGNTLTIDLSNAIFTLGGAT